MAVMVVIDAVGVELRFKGRVCGMTGQAFLVVFVQGSAQGAAKSENEVV